MRTYTRVALVVGVLLLLGSLAATFLPTSPQGAHCGTWVSPEWTSQRVDRLVDQASRLADPEADAIAMNAQTAHQVCSDALSTRRTVSWVLLGLAVLVPAGIVFVGRGLEESTDN